jgi:hypothetical protein
VFGTFHSCIIILNAKEILKTRQMGPERRDWGIEKPCPWVFLMELATLLWVPLQMILLLKSQVHLSRQRHTKRNEVRMTLMVPWS